MTHQPIAQTDYARALQRADSAGVTLLGTGRMKSGLPLYIVSSASTPEHPHIVVVDGSRMTCSCPARRLCQHQAVVRRELERQANEVQERIEQTRASVVAQRETAPIARPAAFSIFKTA